MFTFHTCLKCKSVEISLVEPSEHDCPNPVCFKNSFDDGILIKVHWKMKKKKKRTTGHSGQLTSFMLFGHKCKDHS